MIKKLGYTKEQVEKIKKFAIKKGKVLKDKVFPNDPEETRYSVDGDMKFEAIGESEERMEVKGKQNISGDQAAEMLATGVLAADAQLLVPEAGLDA
eukprot:212560-Alexandrium_andersonii.AAC.1